MIDRSGGGARYRLGVAALAVAALALRLTHIDFGLPAIYHPDEDRKAERIEIALGGGPYTYVNHPGLLMNSVTVVCAGLRAAGVPIDRPTIVLTGRILVALAGALTVLPAAALARALFGGAAGLLAGAALAFSPIHSVHSRYLKEDVYLTLWITMSVWALARWLRQPRGARDGGSPLVWIALGSAGLAAASKYVGALAALFAVLVWWRASGVSWRRAAGALAALAAIPILLTPQLFAALRGGWSGIYDLFWEMRHGIAGTGTSVRLFFFEWPDLGTWFLFHGLGWGLSWPIVVLGIAGIVLGCRRRSIDPAFAMTAVSAVLWYGAAELTPLKLSGPVERYVLPCAPIWTALAAGVLVRWRSSGVRPADAVHSGKSIAARGVPAGVLAVALLVVPIGHSLLLAGAIADDTRAEAARWLAEHGPEPPYPIVYFGIPSYQLDARGLDGVTMTRLQAGDPKELRTAIDGAAVLTFSELDDRRFQDFPGKSARQAGERNALRAEFPHAVMIRKPFYLKAGFHNPDIEIRLR